MENKTIKFITQVKHLRYSTSMGHSLYIIIPKKEREDAQINENDWIEVHVMKVLIHPDKFEPLEDLEEY